MCYYKNRILAPGEILEDFQQSDTCEAKCYCNLNRGGGPSEILCTRLKCPEILSADRKGKHCLKQYGKEKCCPLNSVCGNEKLKQTVNEYFMRFSYIFQMMTSTSSRAAILKDDSTEKASECIRRIIALNVFALKTSTTKHPWPRTKIASRSTAGLRSQKRQDCPRDASLFILKPTIVVLLAVSCKHQRLRFWFNLFDICRALSG